MAGKKRQYTDAQKAAFLAAVDGFATHMSINLAIDKVVACYPGDVSRTALQCWVKGRGISSDVPLLRAGQVVAIADVCDDVVRKSLEMMGVRSEDAEYKDLAVGVGILVEKSQLLRQLPTAINKSVSEMTDDEKRKRLQELANAATNRGNAARAPGRSSGTHGVTLPATPASTVN